MTLAENIVDWVACYFKTAHRNTAVLGLSGGKDSTVAAAICKAALGKDNVVCVMAPHHYGDDCYTAAKNVAEALDLTIVKLWLMDTCASMEAALAKAVGGLQYKDQVRYNLPSRIRMAGIYAVAQSLPSALVINTSNLDERLVGYSTIWGDSCGDIAPLYNLHVSQVRRVGEELGVPHELLDIPPADGLTGVTDEEKLGFTYAEVENWYLHRSTGPENDHEVEIARLYHASEYKRRACVIPSFKEV